MHPIVLCPAGESVRACAEKPHQLKQLQAVGSQNRQQRRAPHGQATWRSCPPAKIQPTYECVNCVIQAWVVRVSGLPFVVSSRGAHMTPRARCSHAHPPTHPLRPPLGVASPRHPPLVVLAVVPLWQVSCV